MNEKDQSDLVPTGRTFVAVDTVGAGEGEIVLCVQGSSARFTPETKQLPIDAAVIGIVDQVQVGSNTVFSARADFRTLVDRTLHGSRGREDVAEPDGRLPSETVPFRTLQIIAGALISGPLVFAAHRVRRLTPGQTARRSELLAYLAAGFAVIAI